MATCAPFGGRRASGASCAKAGRHSATRHNSIRSGNNRRIFIVLFGCESNREYLYVSEFSQVAHLRPSAKCSCRDGRPREAALSEVEGAKPSEVEGAKPSEVRRLPVAAATLASR